MEAPIGPGNGLPEAFSLVRDFGLAGVCGFLLWAMIWKLPRDFERIADKLIGAMEKLGDKLEEDRREILGELRGRRVR